MKVPETQTETPGKLSDPDYFRDLFDEHYRPLTVFALGYVKDMDTAKELVQNLFANLWEKKNRFSLRGSSKAYLYQCVKHACINHLKHPQKHQEIHESMLLVSIEPDVLDKMIETENNEKLFRAIEALPDKCKAIFKMSRFENKTYKEIAREKNLSVKTVENQIAIALKKLITIRNTLISFLTIFVLSTLHGIAS